jgi:general L-amino acid transport system substrate-binding protein
MAPIQAWEFGLDSSNIGSYDGEDPNILRFVGQEDGFDAGLGLPADFAVQAVEQVGNYEEIYEANVTPIGVQLPGTVNDLWTNGGLMYVPPYR